MSAFSYRLLIFCLWGIFTGCATNPIGHESLITVVSGNHVEAVDYATRWLNGHKFLVVDRWVDKEFSTLPSNPGMMNTQQAQMLSMAQKTGASLLVLVLVNEKPTEQRNLSSNLDDGFSQPEVEIQGMNAETATLEYGSKAWNSTPLTKSDGLIINLTTAALQKAFNIPSQAPPPPKAARPGEKHRKETVTPQTTTTKNGTVDSQVLTAPSNSLKNGTSSNEPSLGLQLASGALSIIYAPCKLAYATLGGIVGGFAYALTAGNEEIAHTVWNASLQGTYWLSPEQVRGDTPIYFLGQPGGT